MSDKIPLKQINRLAIPAILSGIVEPLIGIVDTAFVGKSPSYPVESLAAIGLATTFYFFVFWVFVQLETALSSIVAKYLGKNKITEITPLITQAIILNIAIGVTLFLITNAFIETIMSWYNAEGEVLELAIRYYNIRSIGFPIALTTYTLWGVFRGLQNTWWAMVIGFVGGGLNILLDYFFIFGIHDWINPMGVEGAALGSVLAQLVMLLISFLLFQTKTPFKITFQKTIHPELKNLLTISGAYIIRTISLNLVLFKANAMATKFGEIQIAAHTIAMQIWLSSSFILDGYANAGLALSGKLLAEKRIPALKNLIKTLLIIGVMVAVIISFFLVVNYSSIGMKFTNKTEVLSLFNTVLVYIIISQPINAIAFTWDGILKGIAEAKFIRNLMIWAFIVFYIVLTFMEQRYQLGLSAIWIALIGWMIFRAALPFYHLKNKYFSS